MPSPIEDVPQMKDITPEASKSTIIRKPVPGSMKKLGSQKMPEIKRMVSDVPPKKVTPRQSETKRIEEAFNNLEMNVQLIPD